MSRTYLMTISEMLRVASIRDRMERMTQSLLEEARHGTFYGFNCDASPVPIISGLSLACDRETHLRALADDGPYGRIV